MIHFELGVEDLADTRFAISPLQETVFSLWALRDPGRYALHLPWRRAIPGTLDTRVPLALIGNTRALPDFLTPRPATFAPSIEDQLAEVRRAPPELVRRDIAAAHAPAPTPGVLRDMSADRLGDLLEHYWRVAIEPHWPAMRLVLEADMTYRARRLAVGGARLLFADMHPNVSWHDGVLSIDKMIGRHRVAAAGRGLLLVPSIFAYKPVPPISPDEPPWLAYPSRGIAGLWAEAPAADPGALTALLGKPRAGLLLLLAEALPTVEIARRLRVTPSAVSQHLRVLHATGLVSRARDGRQVLYRRSPLGDRLAAAQTAITR
jgi:DNA-binding transcriptional ArsR family regulator